MRYINPRFTLLTLLYFTLVASPQLGTRRSTDDMELIRVTHIK